MKHIMSLSALVLSGFLLCVATPVYGYVPLTTINPNLIIATVTPTPTRIILQKIPIITIAPGATYTLTPTQTPTSTLTPTSTISTPVLTGEAAAPQASESPVAKDAPGVSSMGATPQRVAGFTMKDVVFIAVSVTLLAIIVIQRNWKNIKAWIHSKTS